MGSAASIAVFRGSAQASSDGVGLGFAGIGDPAIDRPIVVLGNDEADVPEGVLRMIERHVWLAFPEVHREMVLYAGAWEAAGLHDHARGIAYCTTGAPDEFLEAVNRVFERAGPIRIAIAAAHAGRAWPSRARPGPRATR